MTRLLAVLAGVVALAGCQYDFGEFQSIPGNTNCCQSGDVVNIYYAPWRSYSHVVADCADRGGTVRSNTKYSHADFAPWYCNGIDF